MNGECAPVLSVRNLRVVADDSGESIVDGISLDLRPGELIGIVGESGSGKTTTVLSMLGHAARGTSIVTGSVDVAGESVLDLKPNDLRRFRGGTISYVAQNAGRALNPAYRIGRSLADIVQTDGAHRQTRIDDALAAVDLPGSTEFLRRLPHQLSGGQQQRVIIAMALSGEPKVVVMDEPTTGLDVVTQAAVIGEIHRIRAIRDIAIVYVSHDLAVVSQLADRVAVMYAGRVVEEGRASTVLANPAHPYTRGLVQSTPDHTRPSRLDPMAGAAVGVEDRPPGCAFAPRCPQQSTACLDAQPPTRANAPERTVECFHAEQTPPPSPREPLEPLEVRSATPLLEVRGLSASHRNRGQVVVAASDIDIELRKGECVALVGESGSGKTTISRSIIGLKVPDGGTIRFKDEDVPPAARRRTLQQRQGIQYVFQDPYDSLNPRRRVGDELVRTIHVLGTHTRRDARAEARRLLALVRLPESLERRYPHQLSGGERQRVAIARALASDPEVLICDEITSALDVSVQAAILELLAELRRELGLSMLLITHDLGVVSVSADRVLVLRDGEICESGDVRDVLSAPQNTYTKKLIAAAPTLMDASVVEAEQELT